jgi:peptidylprolyl isomerase
MTMKQLYYLLFTICILGTMTACGNRKKVDMSKDTLVRMETTEGDIVLKLYKGTPKHRENFLKLIDDGVLEGTLFHRVIKDFMIQGGDPDSKDAPQGKQLGSGGLPYTVPAEFNVSEYFHKRGALAAARQADNVNPMKASSSTQFYIVTGTVFQESVLKGYEKQRNDGVRNETFNALAQKHLKEIMQMRKDHDQQGLFELQEELMAQAKVMAAKHGAFTFTPEQIKAYTTVGGAPHLDGDYTVFGEVVSGMDVIDKIQNMPTDRNDRPLKDVKILKVEIMDEN